ncbi:molybdate transport permease protein [Nitrobacter sp. Nb-311A]|nr:molybdate transport permease protein [Nitrobacter sp. Nb-311A]
MLSSVDSGFASDWRSGIVRDPFAKLLTLWRIMRYGHAGSAIGKSGGAGFADRSL